MDGSGIKRNMQNLRLIEIELFNQCNRRCSWCPNHTMPDRQREEKHLSDEIIAKIIDTLMENNYNGYISFSRYNEPLFHESDLVWYINIFKKWLPNCKIVFNTNGDVLHESVLKKLQADEITIMDYDNKGYDWCFKKLQSLNCTIEPNILNNHFIHAHYGNIKILYYVDWQKHHLITNRGGSLPAYETIPRLNPCYEPLYFIGINYDGTVSPCCNIRNDIENQKPYIIGDLNKQNLSEILNSEERKNFQKIAQHLVKGTPCEFCLNQGGRYTREKGDINYG